MIKKGEQESEGIDMGDSTVQDVVVAENEK